MSITDQELSALYERYAHILFRRCRAILGSEEDAHDAVQETFAKVLRHSDEFRAESSPLTWMYRISTNWCLNQLRNRHGRAQKLGLHGDYVMPTDISGTITSDQDKLRELLATVDAETRACVIHTYFDDCTRQETAYLVGLSVPTVRKRVNDFIELARQQWGDDTVSAWGAP